MNPASSDFAGSASGERGTQLADHSGTTAVRFVRATKVAPPAGDEQRRDREHHVS